MTGRSDDLFRFIGSSFRSVWALELLLLVRLDRRVWSRRELISTLRASELVVNKVLDELVAAGLVSAEGDGARYLPVSNDLEREVEQVEKL